MAYSGSFPPWLEQIDFARVLFSLEFMEDCRLPPLALLQLRRELLLTLKGMARAGEDVTELKALLLPELSPDPVVRRLVQKPAPALVISPDHSPRTSFAQREALVLDVLFLGQGIAALADFARLLAAVGNRGLFKGQGRFRLRALASINVNGEKTPLDGDGPLTPVVTPVSWWLEQQPPLSAPLRLEIVSPMRLVSRGKPLFKAGFGEVFPFIHRRVSQMLLSHGLVEMPLHHRSLFDQQQLDAAAARVEVRQNGLRWQDWRTLDQEYRQRSIGGLTGHLCLTGAALDELLWLLQLGSLLHIGKSAGFGCGCYRLRPG